MIECSRRRFGMCFSCVKEHQHHTCGVKKRQRLRKRKRKTTRLHFRRHRCQASTIGRRFTRKSFNRKLLCVGKKRNRSLQEHRRAKDLFHCRRHLPRGRRPRAELRFKRNMPITDTLPKTFLQKKSTVEYDCACGYTWIDICLLRIICTISTSNMLEYTLCAHSKHHGLSSNTTTG